MTHQTLLQPQEIEVFYVIPTLRRCLAMYMKFSGLKQRKIAELLQIDKATVSQYLHKKRGGKVEFDEAVLKEIAKSSKKIHDKLSYISECQRLLRLIRYSGNLCKIHKQVADIPEQCSPELINCFGGEEHGPNARVSN